MIKFFFYFLFGVAPITFASTGAIQQLVGKCEGGCIFPGLKTNQIRAGYLEYMVFLGKLVYGNAIRFDNQTASTLLKSFPGVTCRKSFHFTQLCIDFSSLSLSYWLE